MRVGHDEMPDSYPRVYTDGSCYTPESVHKHTWGVVMLGPDEKRTLPWHKVESIVEEKPELSEEYRDLGASKRVY